MKIRHFQTKIKIFNQQTNIKKKKDLKKVLQKGKQSQMKLKIFRKE